MKFFEEYFIKETCNQFQAGSNLRSKSKSKKLDETALFGAGCKHEVPLKFFSLKRGEEYVKKFYVSQGSRPDLLSYDGWILGPLFFRVFMDLPFVLVHKNTEKEFGQY